MESLHFPADSEFWQSERVGKETLQVMDDLAKFEKDAGKKFSV